MSHKVNRNPFKPNSLNETQKEISIITKASHQRYDLMLLMLHELSKKMVTDYSIVAQRNIVAPCRPGIAPGDNINFGAYDKYISEVRRDAANVIITATNILTSMGELLSDAVEIELDKINK